MASEWWELFSVGKHRDKKGQVRNWTEADLDRIVTTYDPSKGHEAPICIDHEENEGPIEGGPAYGWVQKLKREGRLLLAKFHQVVPAFAEAVNQGLFKKRSIALYPDGSLRHVAFLGALPPAVKGLRDNTFQEGDYLCYAEAVGDLKFNLEQEESVTVEELEKKLEAEKADNAALQAKNAGLEGENLKLRTEFSEGQAKAKRAELTAFIDQGIANGTVLPAWKDAGLLSFMERLGGSDEVIEFSEGKKQSGLDWFKTFITSFAAHPLFKAMKKPDGAKGGQFAEDEKLVTLIVGSKPEGGK